MDFLPDIRATDEDPRQGGTKDYWSRSSALSDPIRNYRFRVEFFPHVFGEYGVSKSPGWVPSGLMGFNSVSGLAVSTENLSLREGGYNTTNHEIPLQTTYSPVTFQRGVVIGTGQHWDWMKNLLKVVQGAPQRDSIKAVFRSDIQVSVLRAPVPFSGGNNRPYEAGDFPALASADDEVSMKFVLYNAWPRSIAYSDLNAGDSALMVEQLTIVHEGFDVRWMDYSFYDKYE